MKPHYYSIALTVLVLAIASWQFFQKREKNAFLYNQKVFAGFKGTELLTAKLERQKATDKQLLDSLSKLVSQGREDIRAIYSSKYTELATAEQQLSDRYTADIWKQINDGVAAFGKERKYSYIFGASGDGSLMYADEAEDITEELIVFLNNRYEKEGAQ